MPSLNRSQVLITGGTGFVGPHLAKSLLGRDCKVYSLVRRRADGDIKRGLSDLGIQNEVTVIEGGLDDLSTLLNAIDISQPDYIFHLAAQSFVERSFHNPLETLQTNAIGTNNLLEAVRLKDKVDPKLIFAGSSEEYGLVVSSKEQLKTYERNHGVVSPTPSHIPELPIKEDNPLRPLSPYAATKVYGELITLNYNKAYGLKSIVSRAFNHEGARRGKAFVTSVIAKQVSQIRFSESKELLIGNVNACRDWSSVHDIVDGYVAIAEKGAPGDVYNLGSERTNSVITYILLSFQEAGFNVNKIETLKHEKKIRDPCVFSTVDMFGVKFDATPVDTMILEGKLEFELKDKGLILSTNKGEFKVLFDVSRFRPSDVPLLLSSTRKAREKLNFRSHHSLRNIVRDQLNYFAVNANRL